MTDSIHKTPYSDQSPHMASSLPAILGEMGKPQFIDEDTKSRKDFSICSMLQSTSHGKVL